MIQNYLKTGMVFYDTEDKQHFGSKCCKETFYHFTDKTHFPSFQFFTDAVLGLPLGIAWRVFDLDGGDLGAWAANTPGIDTYHLIDNGYNISHDYRDEVIYPAGIINYTDGYYLRLSIDTAAGVEYWYSEAFKVCNCDTEGAGNGINLITGGQFEDWDGAADPANFPIGWTPLNMDAINYVHDAGGKCQMIASGGPTLQIYQKILTIGKWYVATINITNVANGGISLTDGLGDLFATWGTIGLKNIIFQAKSEYIYLRRDGVTNATFTDFRVEEFVGFVFCDKITLNWWSDCNWDDIIYQFGYRNSLVLNTGLDNPSEDIVINPEERQGEMFVRDVIIKKRYKFTIRIPEYLWNAFIRLAAYGSEMPNFHSWVVLPDGSTAPMSEVAITGDWDTSNCMNTSTIDFVDDHEYPVVATNCCADEDYSEIEPEECEKDILSFFHTEEKGSNINVIYFIGHGGPQLFYYNEKTYGCWMQRIGPGYSAENMAYAIYHHYCNISVGYNIGIGTASSLEPHLWGALVVADDGHIVIAHEKSKNATDNGHNSMMYVKRSDNPEDETSWVHAIAHDENYYVEVGNDTNPRFAYPSMDKMADGKIFLICRNSIIMDLDHISVHRSDDNGVSWDAMGGDLDGGYEIVDMEYADDGDIMTYKGLCSHPSGNTVYLFFKVWDEPGGVQPNLYFLLSSDNGVTWKSIDNVLSQDITAAGAITKTQLDLGNGRVFNLPGAGSKIYHMSGVITDAGVPYLAVLRATTADPDYLLYIYYWTGAAWSGVETTIPVSTTDLSGVTILERGDEIEIIALTVETAVWKWRVYHALKTDLADWTIIETIGDTYDGTTVLWSGFTFNYTETDCETFTYVEPTDVDWRDFNVRYKC